MKYITLGEICKKGSSNVAQKDLEGNVGDYEIYGASGFIKKVDFYHQEKPYIAIVKDGAGVGRTMLLPAKSSVIGTMQYILPNDNIDIRYLYYAIVNMNLGKYYMGAAIPHIYFKDYQSEHLPIRNIEEQKQIADIFEKTDTLITDRKAQLSKLDELVKSRFIEMFGDPVDNPLHWDKKQLQEVVTDDCSISYGIVQTGDEQREGVPVFRPIDIVNRIPKLEELKKTTKEISDKYKRTILKGREMLITVRANIADTCVVGAEFAGCNVGRGIVPIRTKEDIIILEFLKHQLDSKHLNDNIKELAKGIALVQLNMEDLRQVELILPPIELQNEFLQFAQQTDKLKCEVKESLEKLETLKKSLMQEYFG